MEDDYIFKRCMVLFAWSMILLSVAFISGREIYRLMKEHKKLEEERHIEKVEVVTDGFKNVVEYKLYVPENTIIQQIDLSAPK